MKKFRPVRLMICESTSFDNYSASNPMWIAFVPKGTAFIPIGISEGSRGSPRSGAPPEERKDTRMTLKGLNGSTNLRSRQDRNALHESFSDGVAAQLLILQNPNFLTVQR